MEIFFFFVNSRRFIVKTVIFKAQIGVTNIAFVGEDDDRVNMLVLTFWKLRGYVVEEAVFAPEDTFESPLDVWLHVCGAITPSEEHSFAIYAQH